MAQTLPFPLLDSRAWLPTMPPMSITRTVATILTSVSCLHAAAQERVIRLYDGPAPGSENWERHEQESRTNLWRTRAVFDVVNPG